MCSLATVYLTCNTCVHWLLFTWHGITKGSTLNKSPYGILEFKHVEWLQHDQIKNVNYKAK
jgi:hypothetical protein